MWIHKAGRWFFALPLRLHLLFLVLLSVLPALGIIIHNSITHRAELERSVTEQSISLIQSIAAKQRFASESAKQLLKTIARLPDTKNKNATALSAFFKELVDQSPGFVNIVEVDPSGDIVASAVPIQAGTVNVADRKYFQDSMRRKDFSVGEFTISRTTGLPALHFAYPILDAHHEVLVMLVAVLDVRKLHEMYAPFLENIGGDIVVSDYQGKVLYASDSNELPTGSPDPYEPQNHFVPEQLDTAMRVKPEQSQEYLLTNSAVILDGESRPYMYFRAYFDLSSLLADERKYLLDSLQLLAITSAGCLALAWILGNALILRRVKRLVQAAQKLSRGQLGYRVSGVVHGAEFTALARAFDELAESLEFRERENRKYQTELLRSARLESLGTLAGGIAHDFNNLLMAISANISLLAYKTRDASDSNDLLDGLTTAVQRAKDLTLQLLTFSKGGKPLKKICNLVDVVRTTSEFVLRGTHHAVELSCDGQIEAIEVDEGQISQVIGNLVINAAQAMETPGTIKIVISNKTLVQHPDRQGTFVRIDIQDKGPGIKAEYLEKVFEPFFTTKATGHGLGLTSSHSIIKNHGGWMEAQSTVAIGTTFSFYLPTTSIDETLKDEYMEKPMTATQKKILVMDDDDILRELMSRMIRCLSHEVAVAANGEQAIDMYREAVKQDSPFDVVILDLTVRAGLGGKETIMRLKTEFPDVRAIAASGFATDDILSSYERYGFKDRLAKPFKIEELQQTILGVCNEHKNIPSAIAS